MIIPSKRTTLPVKSSEEAAAWSSGHHAGRKNAGIGNNPFKSGTPEHKAWTAGYKIAKGLK